MARYQQQTKTRTLREDIVKTPDAVPSSHRICYVALLDGLVHAGMGFTAGKWTRAGRLKLTVYTDDERIETFLAAEDDPRVWLRDTANTLFSKAVADEVVRTVAAASSPLRSTGTKTPD